MRALCAALLALAATPAVAASLDGAAISRTLLGNSILNPLFGCVHFDTPRSWVANDGAGEMRNGRWWIEGERYHSSGSCARLGCLVSLEGDTLHFRRLDGGYRMEARLAEGNVCGAQIILTTGKGAPGSRPAWLAGRDGRL